MLKGVPVSRHCVVTLKTNIVVIDWDNGTWQDVHTGAFMTCEEGDISHTTLDSELESLRKAGLVDKFDQNQVFITALPEPPKRMME